jgi:nitrate reductase gamma subunit
MGGVILAYGLLGISGGMIVYYRLNPTSRPTWLRDTHYWLGIVTILLVLLLLAIGIVGTLGHYGSLGHSFHLLAGWLVVILVLLSAAIAHQIDHISWARRVHLSLSLILLIALILVSLTGWEVVQKYL